MALLDHRRPLSASITWLCDEPAIRFVPFRLPVDSLPNGMTDLGNAKKPTVLEH